MRSKYIAITIMLSLVTSGCATNEHAYADGDCLTCWNNPFTGEPINHNGESDLRQEPADDALGNQTGTSADNNKGDEYPKKFTVSFSVPVNVDVAFIKLKKEFNYYSEQEIRQEWGTMASAKMQTFAYAYNATPSVYYKMRANRKHRGIFVIIDSQIEKQAETRSKVTISYWIQKNSVNPTPYGESLKKRAQHALSI